MITVSLLASACTQPVKPIANPANSLVAVDAPDPLAHTGIAACDAYLASYRSCHRAADIFDPQTLQSHYVAMRDDLLASSRDPQLKGLLANRCMVLSRQLAASLNGKTCQAAPMAAR